MTEDGAEKRMFLDKLRSSNITLVGLGKQVRLILVGISNGNTVETPSAEFILNTLLNNVQAFGEAGFTCAGLKQVKEFVRENAKRLFAVWVRQRRKA